MVKIHKILTGLALWGIISAGAVLCPVWAGAKTEKYTNTDFAMNTVVSETLYTTGKNLNPSVGELLKNTEENLLSWTEEDSQIAALNAAQGKILEVSDELAGYLEKIQQLSVDSEGAFDPTIGKIIRLWDIGGENAGIPAQEELDKLLKETGYEKLELDGNKVTLKDGATLDLGAAGKGIGCDLVMDLLKNEKEVSGMILNLGGSSVMAYGEKPDQSDWRVAVKDPRDPEGEYLGAITLKGGEFLSTSGDYERYFMENGKRYHHILDPETGYPVWNGLTAVTVVCDSGIMADGLSTACFVLGKEKALPLLEKYGADALFADENHKVYLTEGMEERFELMKDTYKVQK